MEKIDLNITQIKKQNVDGLQSSQLTLQFEGKSVNASIINSFRRMSYDYIPTYAFTPDTITVDKNTSIFDNDIMRSNLCQITIPNINVPIYALEDKWWRDVNWKDDEREKHPQDTTVVEMYVNAINTTNETINVTTDKHVQVFQDGVEMQKFDPKYPYKLLELRPQESFICRCVGVLGIGKLGGMWYAAGNCYYNELALHRYNLIMESQGQMDEYEIIHKSCQWFKDRILLTLKIVYDKYAEAAKESDTVIIELENEDHTLCNVINECLQDNKNVIFSGLSKPNLMTDTMVIKFTTIKKSPMLQFVETLHYIVELYDHIQNQIEKLGKKFIGYVELGQNNTGTKNKTSKKPTRKN